MRRTRLFGKLHWSREDIDVHEKAVPIGLNSFNIHVVDTLDMLITDADYLWFLGCLESNVRGRLQFMFTLKKI